MENCNVVLKRVSTPLKKKIQKCVCKIIAYYTPREAILQISMRIARHIERATWVTQQTPAFFSLTRVAIHWAIWTCAHVYPLWIIYAGVHVHTYVHTCMRACACRDAHRCDQWARILAVSVSLILFSDFFPSAWTLSLARTCEYCILHVL